MTQDRWHQSLVHVRRQDLCADTGLETKPGDYIFVPPYVPHQEQNPGAAEAVVIIARSSQEGIVVNLDSLWPDGLVR